MSDVKNAAAGADWTQLLNDPDLVAHLGHLLKTYREAPAETRDQALLDAMREIKRSVAGQKKEEGKASVLSPSASEAAQVSTTEPERPQPVAAAATPPFEPDIFTPSWGQDRRRYPRIKCFVAVELRVAGAGAPVWGNLSNTSLGGCFVETASPVSTGSHVEIGLWVASGKLWVKGLILNGVITSSNPCFGVRVRFDHLEAGERETLKQFLKFVEGQTKGYHQENGYLAQMKR
jgi:hypothetical protein